MSGPTTPCVRCNKATPMVGNVARHLMFGDLGEICPACEEDEA